MKWFGRFCAIVLLFSQAGCAGFLLGVDPDGGAPASAQDYWRPSADRLSGIGELSGQEPTSFVKPDQLGAIEQDGSLGLAQMIDLALRNGPTTRQTWAAARAQAAMVGTDQGAYYPQIIMDGSISYSRGIATSGADSFAERQLGPEWQMSWLLFDFGGREARVRAALAELAAANWAHNQALLDTVLDVVQSYYSYLGARKQVAESKLSVANATESVTVAEARMKEKIGTAYDSLQAQTTLAQIQIQLERYRGQVDVAAGNLNSAMGIPANFKLALVDKPMKPALDTATVSVETMIAVARQRRPDLGAAWATAEASEEQVWVAKSAMLPSFSADGSVQHLNVKENAATSPSGWPYSYGVSASLPIFTGLTNWNEVRAAEATAEANRASAVETEQSVISEVWSSYANFKTAGQMVRTSRTWLVAGEKSYKAARISYANGLGNITELLDAQIALSSARSQLVSAETNWFSSLAQLTHDVGWFERGASPNPVFEEGASPSQSPQANLGQ